jgi:hypothetical protein
LTRLGGSLRRPVDGQAIEIAVAFDRLTRVHRELDRSLRTDSKGGDAHLITHVGRSARSPARQWHPRHPRRKVVQSFE